MRSAVTVQNRAILAAAVLVLAIAMPLDAAGAGGDDDFEGSGHHIVAEVITGDGTVSVRGDSPWSDCSYSQLSTEELILQILTGLIDFSRLVDTFDALRALVEGYEQTGGEFEGELSHWQDVTCPNGLLEPGGRALWPVGTGVPQRVIDAVTRQAADNQELPLFYAHGAPSGAEGDPFVTGVETHLWLDEGAFQPQQAVAQIPGLVQVTVTATPQDPVWNAGDGSASFTCGGPGEPWNDGDRVAECGHLYQRSTSTSSTGTFTLSVTTRWTVESACVNLQTGAGCGTSTLPGHVITSTRPVHVAEIQAIVTDA